MEIPSCYCNMLVQEIFITCVKSYLFCGRVASSISKYSSVQKKSFEKYKTNIC